VPFAIILGEDELAQGKVKIKEMGLPDGHPEKDGVLIDLSTVAQEVKQRLQRKRDLDEVTRQADGLRVTHGTKVEEVPSGEDAAAAQPAN
jgi:histidyl-tRNA synthetase